MPKSAATRQRRNRQPTFAALGNAPRAQYRPLPVRDDGVEWHEQAVALWVAAWASPMAEEYLEADVPGLLIVADLTHQYWHKPNAKTAAELRSQRLVYGLDPKARRSLQWEVARAKEAERKSAPPIAPPRRDPRLRIVPKAG